MTHAENGALLSYLDGELANAEADVLEAHLSGCAGCREALEHVRSLAGEVSGALRLISSEVSVPEARARFDRGRHAAGPSGRPRPWRFATAGMLKAAAVVLALAGAASAAIPGTPVNRWAAALLDRVTSGEDSPARPQRPSAPSVAAPEPAPQEPGASAGVVLNARGGQVQISVHTLDPSARIDIRLVDGTGGIRALTDSDAVRYRTGPGYVEVFDVRTGLVIEIPRNLRSATVEVNGRTFWKKEGDGTR